jgi:hypothetical protein
VCAAGGVLAADTYDWGFCWKDFDALRACAYYGQDCLSALGDNPRHRYIGTWSDGVPVIGLKIQTAGPIGGTPVAARQPKPPPQPNARAGGPAQGDARGLCHEQAHRPARNRVGH